MEHKIESILKKNRKAMTAIELVESLDETAEDISAALVRMTRDGRLILTRKGRYALPESTGLIPARAFVLRSGVPIAKPLDGSEEMRISRHSDLRALNGDLILVRRERRARNGEGGRCDLAAVTERVHPTLTAVLCMEERKIIQEPVLVRRGRRKKLVYPEPIVRRVLSARPFDLRIFCNIDVEGDLMGASVGDAVLLRVLDWPRHKVPMRVQVEKVLGSGWDIRTQLKALAETHHLAQEFSPKALEQAQHLPDRVTEADMAGRTDARDTVLFTIDGADAKDFDDAVSLEKTEEGWRLGVHIADVSHYVTRGCPIDRDARERGTSVYLPGMVLPMLPEALSNGLCSLMPDADRLALSLWMTLRGNELTDVHLERTVIHSAARLTYEEVNRLFEGGENEIPPRLRETLLDMRSVSKTLRQARHARGSIDFDLAEPQFTLDERGMPLDVCARVRGDAEKMIEDFMLLANETVAKMGRNRQLGLLYRIHETPDPDRLHTLEIFLNNLNHPYPLGDAPRPAVLQALLEETEHLPESDVIKQMALRSLKRACYSEKPLGHYGLAADDYCHFTSPIRRYPDLTVHRALCAMLAGDMEKAHGTEKALSELASQCSQCEFDATAAERDADDLLRAHYMKAHEGEEFDGMVSGVTGWGFYVVLPNTVEGLVHVRSLDEYFEFDEARQILIGERSRRIVRLGDRVHVRLESVDIMSSEINFSVLWPRKRQDRRHLPE